MFIILHRGGQVHGRRRHDQETVRGHADPGGPRRYRPSRDRPVARRIRGDRRGQPPSYVRGARRRPERQDFGLRKLHPARQGGADRPQSQDRRRSADRAAARAHLPRQPDHARADRPRRLSRMAAEPQRKSDLAFRTIGELSADLRVPPHLLRYCETGFPQLNPMHRAATRRYYSPDDVALAKRIHRLLNQEGYTIRGVQQLLRKGDPGGEEAAPAPAAPPPANQHAASPAEQLRAIRRTLAEALAESEG